MCGDGIKTKEDNMRLNEICRTPDPEERTRILQSLYDKHKTVTRCAQKLGAEIATVSRWFIKYNVQKKHVNRSKVDSTPIPWTEYAELEGYLSVRDMMADYAERYSITEGAIRLGVSTTTLSQKIKSYRIKKLYVHTKKYTADKWTVKEIKS